METTLFIDDDILTAARKLAAQQDRSVGQVISELSRRALGHEPALSERNGIPLLIAPADAAPVTLDVVNLLLDRLG